MRTLMVADSRERRRRWAACSTISASASTLLIDGTLAATPMNPSAPNVQVRPLRMEKAVNRNAESHHDG